MKKYKLLSLFQKYQMEPLREMGLSQTQIPSTVAVNNSTNCRELRRNNPTRCRTAGQYIGELVQDKTDLRRLLKAKQGLLTGKPKKRIAPLMKHQKWSPKRIAKPLTKERCPLC